MSQPLTVAHRGGQLAYPTWTAHTTNCLESFVDGAGRCEDSRQAGQGFCLRTDAPQSHVSMKTLKAPQYGGKGLPYRVPNSTVGKYRRGPRKPLTGNNYWIQ
jgi:hypothetical protein